MKTKTFSKRSLKVILITILLLVAIPVTAALAASVGPSYPGTASSGGGVGSTWLPSAGTIVAALGADGGATVSADTSTENLNMTNFGFSIPATATITGISVEINRWASGSSVQDNQVQLLRGSAVGSDRSSGIDWSTNNSTVVTYGGDLWGTTWTPAQINNSNFGVTLDVSDNTGGSRTAFVDYVRITVTYKETPTLSVTNSPVTYDGTLKSATVTASVPGTVSNVRYNGSLTEPTNAGTYTITADFTPTDTTNYNSLSDAAAGNFVIDKATPTASITNSPVTYNGSVQTATVACLGGGTATLASGGTGTDAGSYPATVDCAASTNYNAATGLSAGNFVIDPAAPTASITNSPVTYNGSIQTATVACLGGGTATLASGGTGTDAGSYPATVDCAASTNYSAATGLSAGNFVINPAAPTASITNSPVTYNGSIQTATVACLGGGTATLASGGSGTDVGSYPATVDCAASTNYNAATGLSAGSFVINKAAADCGSIAGYSVTYNGNPHIATGTCQGVGSDGTLSGLNLTLTTHTNAGVYNGDAWSFTDVSGNYNDTAGTVDNSIAKANPTLAVTNSPVTYTGLGQAATVDAGLVAGSASNILAGGLATQTDAGTYAVTADFTPTDTTNYNSLVAAPAGNFVINPATATITVNGYTGTYDGLPHGASLAAATGVNSEDLSASVSLGSAFTDVPGGTANWSFTNGNYVSQNGSASIVINPATPILSVTNSPIIFNGAPQSATLSSGLATGVISNIQYDASATAPTAVGSYAVTADFTSSDPNYTDLTGASAGSFVITAKLIPTVTASGGPFDYDGAPHAATVVGSVPGTVSNVKYNNSGTVPTHAGTYSVTADFVPTDTVTYENLLDAAAGSITINQVALTATADNQSINAGEPDPTFTVSYSGFVNGETAAVLNSAPTCGVSVPHADPGTYPIVCSGGIDDNYSFSYVNGTLTVGVTGGGPGNGADTTGVFRPTNGLLYLKNSNDTGIADYALNYGLPGDYPVVGDWDGNGTVTIGIYRGHTFFLRNENTLGFATIVFDFGQDGDQPIAGDWDGDGIDTIGIFRPSNAQFMLRNSNDTGPASATFFLGNPGDVGIAGDWNGDGIDTTGVFRPSNGIIFLKDSNDTGIADYALNYGLPGDKPVMGDWDNDGIDTIGIYRNGTFFLRNENTNGFATIVFGLGNPGDMPIAGNWDGMP